jgi:SAM-dependent methyltransferase
MNPSTPKNSPLIDCPVCSSPRTRAVVRWRSYHVYCCRSCHLRFALPLPTEKELAEFYQGFLFEKPRSENIERLARARVESLRRLFRLGDSGAPGRRFLDYGGGTGVDFNAAQRLGWEVWYHDIDQQAVDFVKETFGVADERILGSLESTDMTFDDILVDNVIEHVPDPVELINRLVSRLRPGGMLVFKTPNAGNTDAYFFPRVSIEGYLRNALRFNPPLRALLSYFRRSWHCDPPRHIWSFSPESMRSIMTTLGIEPGHYEIGFYSVPLFQYSLTRLFGSRVKGARSMVLRTLALPLVVVEVVSKLMQVFFRWVGLLSPGGLILTIRKPL